MTIAADNTKTIVDGNDIATVFNYTFKINFSTDLKVVKTDASDVETVLTEGVHYSVTGVGADAGGSITYPLVGDPLPTGEKITMYRVPAITQLTDIINQGGFLPEVIENALDLLTMIAQMTNEAVNRSIKLDVSDESGADLSLPSPVASTLIGWNSLANALENISPGSVALALPASDSIVASMINAAGTQATLDKLLSGNIVKWQKGSDVASAAALALGSDGNIFDVTGTTAITSIGTVGIGTLVVLQFDGALTLTHHATDLYLPGEANITTAAGDHAIFYEYALGDWRCLGYFRANGDPIFISGRANGDVFYYNSGALQRLAVGNANEVLTISGGVPIWAPYQSTINYIIEYAKYLSKSLDVSSEDLNPTGLYFKSDGFSLYVIGSGTDTVYQYTLSTAWDVSTASYASKSFSVTTEAANPRDMFFKSDGTAMYVLDGATDTVYQYTLSTAWDVSTASYASKSFSVTTQENEPYALTFSSDGTKMYAAGLTNDTVYQYTLSTAWDVSTASYATKSLSMASEDTAPQGLVFNDDGTKLFMVGSGNSKAYEYILTTAWDLSTGSYTNKSFYVGYEESTPSGLFFGNNGVYMYITGYLTADSVFQYSSNLAIRV